MTVVAPDVKDDPMRDLGYLNALNGFQVQTWLYDESVPMIDPIEASQFGHMIWGTCIPAVKCSPVYPTHICLNL